MSLFFLETRWHPSLRHTRFCGTLRRTSISTSYSQVAAVAPAVHLVYKQLGQPRTSLAFELRHVCRRPRRAFSNARHRLRRVRCGACGKRVIMLEKAWRWFASKTRSIH
eukprot:4142141-Amphidinium_carterae.1